MTEVRLDLAGKTAHDIASAMVRATGPKRAMELALEATREVALLTDRIDQKKRPGFGDETIDHILNTVCEYFNVARAQLLGTARHRRSSHARLVAYQLLAMRLDASASEVGQIMSRDHTTILHGWKQVTPGDRDVMAIAARLDAEKMTVRLNEAAE